MRLIGGCAAVLSVLLASGSGWAGEKTVTALAPWEAQGQLYQVAPEEVLFMGRFEGIMYLDGGEGVLDAALLMCPATMTIDLARQKTAGSGRCIITGPKGNMAFGKWECTGAPGQCDGQFTLTGGSGPFEGIQGGGEMLIRTVLTALAPDYGNGEAVTGAAGLARWPKLTYTRPNE